MLRNKQNTILIILFLVFTGLKLFSQDLKKDAALINQFFIKHPKLMVQVDYVMYQDYTTSTVFQKSKAFFKKLNNSTYVQIENMESINTKDYSLVVDNENKSISLLPKKTTWEQDIKNFTVNLEDIKLSCDKYYFNKEDDNSFSYTFEMKDEFPEYEKIKVVFNSNSYCIEKIIMLYAESDISENNEAPKMAKPRIEINYTKVDTKPGFKESDLTYEKFLIKTGSKYSLKPEYQKYSLNAYSL
jgi:hypothetical protein